MVERENLTAFQVEVAHLFFEQEESAGFALAGGAALLARKLIARPPDAHCAR